MNVHHLELFYFVAKFEGITEAVRKMPYGIQQPAVSGQILQLEKYLEVKLFHRRPFALTPAGEDLYDFIYPFFSRLDQVSERLRGEESQHLRLAASATVLTNHLPEVLRLLRKEHPQLRLTLRDMSANEVESALQKQEADVAVAILRRKTAPGIRTVKLLQLPLAILAPETSQIATYRELTSRTVNGQITHPLIALPQQESVSQLFQDGLGKKKLRWETSMEVSELELVQNYVARGFGFGLVVDIPKKKWSASVKKIKLPKDFPPLTIGALHTGELKSVARHFIDLAKAYAGSFERDSTTGEEKEIIDRHMDALIFDFDGLILDTEVPFYETWKANYAAYGQDLPLEVYEKCVGSDYNGFNLKTYLESLIDDSVDWEAWDQRRDSHALELVNQLETMPGIHDLLESAEQSGVVCALASSSPRNWVLPQLERTGLLSHFQIIRCVEDVSAAKPSPELFLSAVEGLGTAPEDALVLEDSLNGLRASLAAGIPCVAVPCRITEHLNFSGALKTVSSLTEVSLSDLKNWHKNSTTDGERWS